MKEVFDTYIENSFAGNAQCPVKKAQFFYNYKKFFPAVDNANFLDIGIGRGEMLSCWQEMGIKNFKGIDISPSAINFCKKLNLSCELVESTEDFLYKHENSYDIITLLDVLEHIPKDRTLDFLKAIKYALKPGGKVIIQVPNMQAVDAVVIFYGDFTHCAGFTEHSFSQIFSALQFTEYEIYPYEVFCYGGYKEFIAKLIRPFFYTFTRFRRKCIGAHCPEIITPIFYTVAEK